MTRDWDAPTYDRVSGPQVEWAREVIERLDLRGDETVLDAGCGTGRVTRMLLERCARVIAVDGSESMVEEARAALPADVTVLHQDLQELHLDEPVDAAFSNAVFHWVPDHALLFRRIFGVLRPGGRLVAQCGGAGNVERFHAVAREVGAAPPFAQYLEGWDGPWIFADADATAMRLEGAGFTEVETWLTDEPVVPEFTEEYIRTVCLGSHVDRLPEELRGEYVTAVAECSERPMELDYVRLNILAERPA